MDRPISSNFATQMESVFKAILNDSEPEIIDLDELKAFKILHTTYKSN